MIYPGISRVKCVFSVRTNTHFHRLLLLSCEDLTNQVHGYAIFRIAMPTVVKVTRPPRARIIEAWAGDTIDAAISVITTVNISGCNNRRFFQWSRRQHSKPLGKNQSIEGRNFAL